MYMPTLNETLRYEPERGGGEVVNNILYIYFMCTCTCICFLRSMSILASREHTCIHPKVSKSRNKNDDCKKLRDYDEVGFTQIQ